MSAEPATPGKSETVREGRIILGVDVYGAAGRHGGDLPPVLELRSGLPIPDWGEGWPSRQREEFFRAARLIADAMFQTLPGGLTDALFAVMAERKASDLIVAYGAPEAPINRGPIDVTRLRGDKEQGDAG